MFPGDLDEAGILKRQQASASLLPVDSPEFRAEPERRLAVHALEVETGQITAGR